MNHVQIPPIAGEIKNGQGVALARGSELLNAETERVLPGILA